MPIAILYGLLYGGATYLTWQMFSAGRGALQSGADVLNSDTTKLLAGAAALYAAAHLVETVGKRR